MRTMKILNGKAEKLRVGVEVSGSDDQITSTHVATMVVSGKAVRMEMPSAFVISEGDELVMAGDLGRDGIVKAYAYRNVSNGARGCVAGFGTLIVGFIFTLVGICAAGAVLFALLGAISDDGWASLGIAAFASVFMLVFGLGGIRTIKLFVYSSRARSAVG